jgi:hypothetical protein
MNEDHILFIILIAIQLVRALKMTQAAERVFVTQMGHLVDSVGHALAGVVLAKVCVQQVAQKPAQIHKDVHIQ